MLKYGLIALLILLPAFAHAANPPALTVYTISSSTIYPTATADSGLATTTAIDTAFSEQVKVSIKIISASGVSIKSLYSSSSVTNPAPKIWDGTNTAGTHVDNGIYTILINATSTATSLVMADSSKTVTIASPGGSGSSNSDSTPPDTSSNSTDTTTTVTTSSDSGPPEYVPIPTLHIITNGDRTVSSGADVAFDAVVYDGKGNRRDDAMITWSFGDGMRKTGASVFHAYYDPGEYVAIIRTTTSDGGNTLREIIITVKDAHIKIASVSPRGITLVNNDSRILDLSLWRLSMGGKEFKIPDDTQILAGHSILFPSQVIELPISESAFLLYPNGEVAANYPPVSSVQPLTPIMSFNTVQKVEPIISQGTNIQSNEHAVSAPAAATEIAAAGAVMPHQLKTMSASTTKTASFH